MSKKLDFFQVRDTRRQFFGGVWGVAAAVPAAAAAVTLTISAVTLTVSVILRREKSFL